MNKLINLKMLVVMAITVASMMTKAAPLQQNRFTTNTDSAMINGNTLTNVTASNSVNFAGSLVGDVTGHQGSTTVAQVNGTAASVIASGANAANSASATVIAGRIIKRDASGNIAIGSSPFQISATGDGVFATMDVQGAFTTEGDGTDVFNVDNDGNISGGQIAAENGFSGDGSAISGVIAANGVQYMSPTSGAGDVSAIPFITTPTVNGIFGTTHNNAVASLWWNFGGASNGWNSNFNIRKSLAISGSTNDPATTAGEFPMTITANSTTVNQTNGFQVVTNAQGVIRIINMSAYGNSAIYCAMVTNTGTVAGQTNLSKVVDPNAIQFGTVNANLGENLSGNTVGAIADGGFTWVFAVPQNVGGEVSNPNHTWFSYIQSSNIVAIEGLQPNIWSATNPLAIHAIAVYTKASFGALAYGISVYSNIFVGGEYNLGVCGPGPATGTGQAITVHHAGVGYLLSSAMEPTGTMNQTNYNCNQTSGTAGAVGYGWAGGPRLRSDASGDMRFDLNTTQALSLLTPSGSLRLEVSAAQFIFGSSGDVGIQRGGSAALKVTDGSSGSGSVSCNGILSQKSIGAAPTTISVTASPFTFTAPAGANIEVYIGGGIVTAVAKNSTTLASGLTATGLMTVSLKATETLTVTYTSLPVMQYSFF